MNKLVTIRRASAHDAETLGVIGPAAYATTYHYLSSDSITLIHQLDTFSKSVFLVLLQRDDSRVWAAEKSRKIIGFLTMLISS